MKERPILFSSAMVRAILDGRKTQTRRIVKVPYVEFIGGRGQENDPGAWGFGDENGCWHVLEQSAEPWFGHGVTNEAYRIACPYGDPGDRLWVREEHYRFGHWESVPGVKTKTGRMKWRFVTDATEIRFDAPTAFRKGRHHKDPATPAWHKRLARFMPRSASRLTLAVESVRVERLQDITEEDARAEGVVRAPFCKAGRPDGMEHVDAFECLWREINGAESWDANPWVWVVGFRRVRL